MDSKAPIIGDSYTAKFTGVDAMQFFASSESKRLRDICSMLSIELSLLKLGEFVFQWTPAPHV